MTRVTSRRGPLFQSVRVRLRFASTHIIRISSGSLFAILKNTVRVRLRFDKDNVKPVYKTSVRVRFDFLIMANHATVFQKTLTKFGKIVEVPSNVSCTL